MYLYTCNKYTILHVDQWHVLYITHCIYTLYTVTLCTCPVHVCPAHVVCTCTCMSCTCWPYMYMHVLHMLSVHVHVCPAHVLQVLSWDQLRERVRGLNQLLSDKQLSYICKCLTDTGVVRVNTNITLQGDPFPRPPQYLYSLCILYMYICICKK